MSSPIRIQSKLPAVGTTIFTVMSALAAEHKAINLGQGFPDYPMSAELTGLVDQAMRNGHNQYVHMNGYGPLREALAEKVQYLYGTSINPDSEIAVTPGATYGLFTALATVLVPGDEVIVFEPAYDCYIPQIELMGAQAVTVNLLFPDYRIDWNAVREKLTERTRAIVINTPHNPTGAVLTKEDLAELEGIVEGTQIVIIADEVYEHLIFDGLPHESVLKYPALRARSFAIYSFGKVYNCTGWKLGYCIAPAPLMAEFRKIHQFNAFTCDTPKQVALAGFLQDRSHYLDLGAQLQQKRDFFQNLMAQTRFRPLPSHGSYFQSYSYKDISSEAEKDFAIRLTKEAGVATIPVSSFYRTPVDNGVLRFCFSKKNETLEAAVERLKDL
ncbi:methionine aminotransferase [Flaviaesturariibacter aridisoli]|uniref:Aminotransferase class I/II-fold pyridoxal phosphate-dependent enzyme n=1 Tax=Flaviaesturariibacter aridisoli TaxID=2545761 RepID=A0A4R4DU26_9BACT|nr:methionine aminotransferase [Flaviaesturariibacter aridisoli]TCZ66423.1 aminotransferase class I/II-fold pyridoxal phosphate-dependent enzyme [Flaviaesturariibacter aridisoli]